MTVQSKAALIIFDMDGTLADRDTGELLPGVADWFERFKDFTRYAIATNQGGVGLRYWMEKDGFGEPDKYPTEAQIEQRITEVCNRLGGQFDAYMCFAYQSKKSGQWGPIPENPFYPLAWQQDWRKPAPGMLLHAMHVAGARPEQTIMVGDSEEDERAAKAAGCHFRHADDFFHR